MRETTQAVLVLESPRLRMAAVEDSHLPEERARRLPPACKTLRSEGAADDLREVMRQERSDGGLADAAFCWPDARQFYR